MSVKDFVTNCVFETVGPAACESGQWTQLEIISADNADALNVVVKIVPEGESFAATISGHTPAGTLRDTVLTSLDWRDLAARVIDHLPLELFDADVNVRFTGERTNGTAFTPGRGSSVTNTLEQDTVSTPAPAVKNYPFGTIERGLDSLLNVAVDAALEFLTSGAGNYAQVKTETSNEPGRFGTGLIWVNFNLVEHEGQKKLHAATNDQDFMVGYPPSFWSVDTDASVVKAAVLEFLTGKFAEKNVNVMVFRSPAKGWLPILEGNSEFGTFGEKVEPIIGC